MDEVKNVEFCFWCGEPKDKSIKDEINSDNKKSFRPVINNYNPCERCKEIFSNGIHVIGVSKEPVIKTMFPITKTDEDGPLYPTGSMFVADDYFIEELLDSPDDKELKENVLKERIIMLPDEFVSQMIKEAREQGRGQSLDSIIKDKEGETDEENVQNQGDEDGLDGDNS